MPTLTTEKRSKKTHNKSKETISEYKITFEQFLNFIPSESNKKYELIDGKILVHSPPTTKHEDINGFLYAVIRDYVEYMDLGKVFGSRTAVKLDEYNAPEPDILFISKQRLHQIKENHIDTAPDFVVEIVSPSTQEHDKVTKFQKYEKWGVKEYWIIDIKKEILSVYEIIGKKYHLTSELHKGKVMSHIVKDFWINVEWLWEHPLPKSFEIARKVLGIKKSIEGIETHEIIQTLYDKFGEKELLQVFEKVKKQNKDKR